MTLVSKNIPNLINGVSQQPPALRLASQGEAQENGFSDIVDGLKKRPPTQLKNKLKKTAPNGNIFLSATEINRAHFHTYKRSTVEQYTVVTDPVIPKMYVYDIDGNLRYESGVASWDASGTQIAENDDNLALVAYLGTDVIDNTQVAATSVADYTFFVNKDKVVEKDTSTPSNVRPHEGMFYLKQMNFGKDYRCQILNSSGTTVVDGYLGTRDGISGDTNEHVNGLRTGNYFKYLLGSSGQPPNTGNQEYYRYLADNASQQWTTSELNAANITTDRNIDDPFIVVKSTQGNQSDFDIESSDDNGGADLFSFKDKCKNFISLPQFCVDGFTIQVNGDNQKKEDDFYVEFAGSNTAGTWKECAAPSRPNTPVYHTFDTATMPHTLSQNADLSFTFGTSTWDDRKCGDDDTNPFPSFVGNKINGVFFHRNRLGFLSDENVIFSEASSYFNFFRVTVRSLLDSAPIDVAVSQNEVSLLKAAVPAQDNLILFSDLTQFTLSADQLLTPSEIVIDQSTKYECDLTSTPVGAGTSVFFTTKSGDYSGVREFFTKDDSENKDAPSITSHVPEYLNGTVRQMVASSNEDMLVCLTEADKKECYVYKWYTSAQERIQSSWSKWVFSKEISHVFFNNATLTIIFNDGAYEEMSLSSTQESTAYQEITQTDVSGVSGSTQTGAFGYSTLTKGYSLNINLGTSPSSLLTQAFARQTLYNGGTTGVTNPYIVKLTVLKALFSGSSAYEDSALPPTIKITNNDTGHAFNKGVAVQGSGNSNYLVSSNYFVASQDEANNYVDFEVSIDVDTFNAMFNGSFTVAFVYASTTVNVDRGAAPVLLDHRKTLTGLVNQASLVSVYTPTANTRYINHKGNLIASGSPADGDALYTYLAGTHVANGQTVDNYVVVGETYTFKYKLSEQVFKAGDKDPTRMARYQLRSVLLNYTDTGSFDVTVSSTGRDDKVTNFTGRILGQFNNILGYSPVVEDGALKVGIQSQAQATDITITNDSHLPSTFQNAEVEAFVTLRNKRI